MYLSEHLTLQEFEHSNTAEVSNISNYLPPDLLSNATYTGHYLFEPIRELLGVPLDISSGYRCPELNKLVRGVETSQHVQAQAIDFIPRGINILSAFQKICDSDLKWDQLILEHDKDGHTWIHASIKHENNRHQIIGNLLK